MAFNSYILSDAESQRIFDEEIVPNELGPAIQHQHHHHHHQDGSDGGRQPLAVLIVGQTGAGKTRVAPILKDAMAAARRGRPPAHFIADTYKAYHPAYASIAASDRPERASPATGTDARRWLTMACARAVEVRADALVESACRHPDDFRGLAEAFHAGGYRVRVAVLAVPGALSRLGILARFHQDLPEARSGRLPLRLTPRGVHDESYAGLRGAVEFVDGSEAAEAVAVVRRGNLVAYRADRRRGERERDGGWGGAAAALEAERKRPLPKGELAAAVKDLEALEKLGVPSVAAQIEEIQGLIEPLMGDVADPEGAGAGAFPELVPLDAAEFVGGGLM